MIRELAAAGIGSGAGSAAALPQTPLEHALARTKDQAPQLPSQPDYINIMTIFQ
jgi:hypothetical protein